MPERRRTVTGWGRTSPASTLTLRPHSTRELDRVFSRRYARGLIARGMGRSYGDAAQRSGGATLDMTAIDDFTVDPDAGTVTASGGASLDELMKALVPQGWFVPVTPGTRYVTVGGAVAADVHGKNHHLSGSWCNHVSTLDLLLPTGEILEVGPDKDPELFWATAGGMGLTGVVVDATFRCSPIQTSRILVDTDRADDLDAVMTLMSEGDASYDYSVAWIDLMASGRHTGRSVLTRGAFAGIDQLERTDRRDPLHFEPRMLASTPPGIPSGLLNRASIKAFNEMWFRKAPRSRRGEIQSIAQFFHPLDMVDNWNRLYGPRGFLQWQFVIPFGAEDTLRAIVDQISHLGCTSFLAVLKRMGAPNPGMLSFPIEGWTLALDIPVGPADLGALLDRLDEQVVSAGGRIYLAKDSRVRSEMIPRMYPRLDEWRKVRDRVDPDHQMNSDLAVRLGL